MVVSQHNIVNGDAEVDLLDGKIYEDIFNSLIIVNETFKCRVIKINIIALYLNFNLSRTIVRILSLFRVYLPWCQ